MNKILPPLHSMNKILHYTLTILLFDAYSDPAHFSASRLIDDLMGDLMGDLTHSYVRST